MEQWVSQEVGHGLQPPVPQQAACTWAARSFTTSGVHGARCAVVALAVDASILHSNYIIARSCPA